MANKSGIVVGIGCLVGLAVVIGVSLMVVTAMQSRLPSDIVLSVRLAGPIVEVSVDDPFAELTGNAPTSMRDLRRALILAADDDRVRGVRLRLDSVGGGFANAQEIRALLARVSAAGKWTAAYMDTAGEFAPGNRIYYLASACDEISLNPAGDVNLIGLSVRSPFIRGAFDKLGIKPEFPGRGPYKTARFMYTETEFTAGQREMMEWLAGSIMDQMVNDIAIGRGLDLADLRNSIDSAPLSAAAAAEAGLVDHLEDWTSYRDRLAERESAGTKVVGLSRFLQRVPEGTGGDRIAVVTAIGSIMRGESGKSINPLFGGDIDRYRHHRQGVAQCARRKEHQGRRIPGRLSRWLRSGVGDHSPGDDQGCRGDSGRGLDVERRRLRRLLDQLRRPAHRRRPGHHHRVDRGLRRPPQYRALLVGKARHHIRQDGFWRQRRHLWRS